MKIKIIRIYPMKINVRIPNYEVNRAYLSSQKSKVGSLVFLGLTSILSITKSKHVC